MLKKALISLFCLFLLQLHFSQEKSYQMRTTASKDASLLYTEISGSPYLDNDFKPAKAACCSEIMPMRYDTFADNIEYKKDNVIYSLLKEDPYTKIEFIDQKLTLALEDVEHNNKPHYFVLLVDGNNLLLKKVTSKIEANQDTKKPTSFGGKNDQASFKKEEPVYYLKTQKKVYSILKNKKDVLELYPEQADRLNKFFNDNKIKFNKEESLIKLVSFLNQ